MSQFGLRLENQQPGEAAMLVELQHDWEFLQQLARQFPDEMAVRRHLAFSVLPQFHCDQMSIKANFNAAFLQPHQPIRRDGPIALAKPARVGAMLI